MTAQQANAKGLGWFGIVRLGAVQAAIGAMVMLATSLLNRVMVVEYGIAAAIPAGLVAWHYAVQLSRPLWGIARTDPHAAPTGLSAAWAYWHWARCWRWTRR